MSNFHISLYKVDIVTCFQCVIIFSALSVSMDILLLVKRLSMFKYMVVPRFQNGFAKRGGKDTHRVGDVIVRFVDVSDKKF